MLDRYHIEHELETGARGAIFRGRDRKTGRVVAIKLMADAGAVLFPARKNRGLGELADDLASLSHPHIAAMYESARAGHLRYIVMEFAEGTDLRAHSSPSTLLPLSTVLSIAVRVADAVQHLHRCGVVHGDIKPANIVFNAATDRVKLTDIGARLRDSEPIAGTPAYMAPEQLYGFRPSAAADQFAFGVTLYQLTCGHLPFTGPHRPAIVRRIVNEAHADIRVHQPTVPASVVAILDKTLGKNADARYSSFEVLKHALRSVSAEFQRAPSGHCFAACSDNRAGAP
jgi:eukaryotic-like serine/threonine-protein kinase